MDLFSYLLGTWRLRRRLVDERIGAEGRFEGMAYFEPDGPGTAAYREEGVLAFLDHLGPAQRRLRCVAVSDEVVAFSFSDGRFFHLLERRSEGFGTEHLCGEDRYFGRFVFLGDDRWRARWHVEGPRKTLTLDGSYLRLCPRSTWQDSPITVAEYDVHDASGHDR
jgi:hypothetical protein